MKCFIETKQRLRLQRLIAAVLFLGLISACSTQTEIVQTPKSAFHQSDAQELFSQGFRQIADKYIEAIPVSQLALGGMKGLGSIDPDIIVTQTGNTITLQVHDQTIRQYLAPAKHDDAAWAALTVNLWLDARDHSSTVRNARREKIYEAIFDGSLSKLDGYSRYAGKTQARRNRNRRDGFGGIGIRFRFKRGLIHVIRVMKNSPAAQAGLQRGDVITHVGDVPLKGLKSRDIIAQLHGPIKSLVNITISRPNSNKPIKFSIVRALIVPNTVTSKLNKGFVIVRIRSFNQKTSERTKKHIIKARQKMFGRLKGVVLDLRGNPGGLLKQAIKVADLFLKKTTIVSTRGRHPDSYQYYEADFEDVSKNIPLAVLIDGKSASAAEVLAAALQDSGRAVIIGTTSYGKGTVQSVIRLPNEGEITLTWSRLHSPAGYIFHNLGIFPSICTSGQNKNPAQLIQSALKQHTKVLATYRSWWQSNGVNDEKRSDLREICPPERRKSSLEVDIALQLIADKLLYARSMMDVPELAQNPHQPPPHELSLQP